MKEIFGIVDEGQILFSEGFREKLIFSDEEFTVPLVVYSKDGERKVIGVALVSKGIVSARIDSGLLTQNTEGDDLGTHNRHS